MKQPSIRKNYIYNTFYQILSLITPLITAPYLARVLGPDGVGIQSYTASVCNYFVLFAMLGTASYGQREIAGHRDDKEEVSKIFWQIELITIGATLVCLLFWGILILCSHEYREYYIALTFTIIGAALDISWFFAGFERFNLIVIRNTVIKLVGIVLIFTFVKAKDDLIVYIVLNALSGMVGQLSMWGYLKSFLVKVEWKKLRFKEAFQETLVYFLPSIATSVYTVLDKTMIGLITKNSYENGYYEQTNKIVSMGTSIVCSLNTVMSSRMSYLFSQKKYEEIRQKLGKSLDYCVLLSCLLVGGIFGIAAGFVPWFFGKAYEPVIVLLRVYCPLVFIIAISNCLGGQYLTPSGQRIRSLKAIITGSATNFICNLFLIPNYGAVGAAIASLVAEGVILCMYLYMSKEYVNFKQLSQLVIKRGVACIVMAYAMTKLIAILQYSTFSIFLSAGVAVIIYILCVAILGDSLLSEIFNGIMRLMKNGK